MNSDKNNNNLDELITEIISRNKPKFDFNKWKENHEKEIDLFKSQEKSISATFESNTRRIMLWYKAACIAAAFLVICSLAACFVLSGKVTNLKEELVQSQQNVTPAPADDSAIINFYLEEHRDLVARHASTNPALPKPAQMRVSQQDIMYYESFDDEPEYMYPGIIVRGPSSGQMSDSGASPVISNGHTLTLTEARHAAGFKLVSPAWLRPAYALDQIRRIEGRDTLQLLYTDGIDSVSLFEQPLDGQRGLEPKDFREYAIYRNKGQSGGTILVWRDGELSYVLIGNTDLTKLMDMAQSISAAR